MSPKGGKYGCSGTVQFSECSQQKPTIWPGEVCLTLDQPVFLLRILTQDADMNNVKHSLSYLLRKWQCFMRKSHNDTREAANVMAINNSVKTILWVVNRMRSRHTADLFLDLIQGKTRISGLILFLSDVLV